jgi:hypothetical protein
VVSGLVVAQQSAELSHHRPFAAAEFEYHGGAVVASQSAEPNHPFSEFEYSGGPVVASQSAEPIRHTLHNPSITEFHHHGGPAVASLSAEPSHRTLHGYSPITESDDLGGLVVASQFAEPNRGTPVFYNNEHHDTITQHSQKKTSKSSNYMHQSISLDKDIMDHYDVNATPRKPKQNRGWQDSVESRHGKIHRRSTSHSTAPTIPSTKVLTPAYNHSPSRDLSVTSSNEDNLFGASRTSGGIFRGKALGNVFNMADAHNMDVDDHALPMAMGKVLLYTSRDQDAEPAMTMSHETGYQLPPVLDKLARKYSPIRSELVHDKSSTMSDYAV